MTSCQPSDFCDDPRLVSFTPNLALSESYDNFINRLDLACASSSNVGMIGSAYFLGWVVSLLILPRLSDLYGRNKLIQSGAVVSTLAFMVIAYSSNYSAVVAAVTVLGMN